MSQQPVNKQVAAQLWEIADLLEQQGANPFRVNAYRHAAETVDRLEAELQTLFDAKGIDGLIELPNIGRGIARTIYEILSLGRSSRLDNLRGSLEPERLFQTIPGVGAKMAHKIHESLQVDSLEALEVAAHDGRLEKVPGVGYRRAAAIRAALADMLGRRVRRRPEQRDRADEPSVAMILDVDREYRAKAEVGTLPTIAPRRFNPEGKAWLPILHTNRDDWHFTALFSNTARAHELGRTKDWVVIYWYDDHHHEDQQTVVTEHHGPLTGQRVVRGREMECRAHYAEHAGRQ